MSSSKVSDFFKRDKPDDEQALSGSGEKPDYCTIGATINYCIIADFVAIFVSCLIIVGSLGTLRSDLSKSQLTVNSTATCYMYASYPSDCSSTNFGLDSAHTCDGMMVGFSFVAVMAVCFVIGLFIKAILRLDLNRTLYIEIPVLVVCILLVFALSVTISIGNVTTCNALKNYNNCQIQDKTCNGMFPQSQFGHTTRANIAQNTAWFVFLFVFIAIILFVIRLVVYLKRRKKQAIQRTLDKEDFGDDGDTEGPKAI